MTRLIYPNPIELDGKVIVSTEILTYFECPVCGRWSTVSDVQTDQTTVHCTYCGTPINLPITMPEINAKWIDNTLKPTGQFKTNAISPDAGMPQRGVK